MNTKKRKTITPIVTTTGFQGLNTKTQDLTNHVPAVSLASSPLTTLHLEKAPRYEERSVNTHADLQRLLGEIAERASDTKDTWLRDPAAAWVVQMKEELVAAGANLDTLRERQRHMASTRSDEFLGVWEQRTEFANEVLNLWFRGKTAEQVIERARTLGHFELPQGYTLCGAVAKQLGVRSDEMGTMEGLHPVLNTLCPTGHASLYTVKAENHFLIDSNESCAVDDLFKPGSTLEHKGSLNTTYDYQGGRGDGAVSGLPLLDTFYEEMEELTAGLEDKVELHRRMYLIWKGQGYMTPHHQAP